MIRRRKSIATLALLAGMALSGLFAGNAAAVEFGIDFVDGQVTANEAGDAYTQAGGHPYSASTFIQLNNEPDPDTFIPTSPDDPKDVRVDLPPGFIGNPAGMPTCPITVYFENECPTNTVVGVSRAQAIGTELYSPVFNLSTTAETTARFGTWVFNIQPVIGVASVRSGSDYGISLNFDEINQALPLTGLGMTLWGDPADSSHDTQRCGSYTTVLEPTCFEPSSAGYEPVAFLSLPTSCPAPGVGIETSVRMNSWGDSGTYVDGGFISHLPPAFPEPQPWGPEQGPTGCEQLRFDPTVDVQPRSHVAGAPTGVDITVTNPQYEGLETPDVNASAHLKRTLVELPEGMTVNAAAASGMTGCSPAQIGLASEAAPTCPDSSKLGSVEIDTPLLDEDMKGSVYLATQNDNPFGSLLALYIYASGKGVQIKLPGRVATDPSTGRLTTTFDNNPQLPFETLSLAFNGGSRAPLVNPSQCGAYTTHSEMTSWARPDEVVSNDSRFSIDQGCGNSAAFTPGLEAGTTNPVGGKYSSFTLRVSRPDGQQNIGSLQTTLPEGLLAKLAGVPLCPDSAVPGGNCPAASQVGTATVGAGSGTDPVYVPEVSKAPTAVYLAGPYKGGPYSLVAKVPAQAGPFDLGTVVVRNAIHVDPVSAQVSVQSDPLPQILQGIPVSYRDIQVDVTRSEFTVNPTSCDPMAVTARVASAGGASVALSDRFQVAGCERLGFKPKLKMKFYGAPPRRGGFPALTATLTAPKGQANIGKASVLLPGTELLEQNHIRTICTRDQWASDTCPKAAIYGKAKAWTPLLDKPLEGPVYLRANGGARELPDLVADLRGQIKIELAGYIDTVKRNGVPRMRTRFLGVPDAPVTKFVLQMQGGRKGLLANNTNLCKAKPRAGVQFDGQNGKVHDINPLVAVSGCGKKGK